MLYFLYNSDLFVIEILSKYWVNSYLLARISVFLQEFLFFYRKGIQNIDYKAMKEKMLSIEELEKSICGFIIQCNLAAHPFKWTYA